MPRSRGAASGILLVLLGVAAALAPLLGPEIGLTIGSDETFDLTEDRLILSVIPGAVVALGGLLLLLAANRPVAMFGGLLALAGGIWLVVGPLVSRLWEDSGGLLGAAGRPAGDRTRQTIEVLAYFNGIGALITALAGIALGRLAIKAASDHRRDHDDHDRVPAAPVPAPEPRREEPVVEEEPERREPVVEEPVHREPVVEEPQRREIVEEPVRPEPVLEEPRHSRRVEQEAPPQPEAPTRVVEPAAERPPSTGGFTPSPERSSQTGDDASPPERSSQTGGDAPPQERPSQTGRDAPQPSRSSQEAGQTPARRSGGLVDRVRGRRK